MDPDPYSSLKKMNLDPNQNLDSGHYHVLKTILYFLQIQKFVILISSLHDSLRKSEIHSHFLIAEICVVREKLFLTGFIFCSLDPDP